MVFEEQNSFSYFIALSLLFFYVYLFDSKPFLVGKHGYSLEQTSKCQ